MLQIEDLKQELQAEKPKIEYLRGAIGYDALLRRRQELEEQTAEEGFWDDMERSKTVLKEQKALGEKIGVFRDLLSLYEDTETMLLIAQEEGDALEEDDSVLKEIRDAIREIASRVQEEQLAALLSGEFDANNAIMSFHAGAGGTEAQDWVQMLYRMYCRWAEQHHFKVKVLDYLAGEEAGIKSVSIQVIGLNAYGFLRSESGVHRLVRVSPFDTTGRRHTSFASIEVMPELDDDYEIEIRPEDLKVDTYRSGGAGGQHVNKTESAIRITHIPTGTVVECQDERSQHKNKEKAMKILRSRIYEKVQREQNEQIASQRKLQVGAGDRAERIRTYNYPQGRLTDHRIGLTLYKLEAILNGDLDELFDALNTFDQAEKLKMSGDENA